MLAFFNKTILVINDLRFSDKKDSGKDYDFEFYKLFRDSNIYGNTIRNISAEFYRIYWAKNPQLSFNDFKVKYKKQIEFMIHLGDYVESNTYWGLSVFATQGPDYERLDPQYKTALNSKKHCLDTLLELKIIDTTLYGKLIKGEH
jgi:hypothetical protein